MTGEVPNGLEVGSSDEKAGAERVPEAVKRTVLGRHTRSLEEFPGPLSEPEAPLAEFGVQADPLPTGLAAVDFLQVQEQFPIQRD